MQLAGTGETTASQGFHSRPSWLGVSVVVGVEAALMFPHWSTASKPTLEHSATPPR